MQPFAVGVSLHCEHAGLGRVQASWSSARAVGGTRVAFSRGPMGRGVGCFSGSRLCRLYRDRSARRFRIGFDYGAARLLSAKRNLLSASSHTAVIDKYLAKERACGRLVGPIRPEARSRVHLSPFGVIPKSNQPGRWRLIVDLSSPRSQSVNDGISPALASLRYSRIDDAVKFLSAFRGPVDPAKIDLESAYRMIPVHPVDSALLGVRWHGNMFVDSALPFGLRSAPKIFSAVADASLWVILRSGV